MLTLFDFDGTLCDTRDAIVAGLRTLVTERLSNPPSDEVLVEHVSRGTGLHATIRSLHHDPTSIEHEIDDWATHYRTAYGQHAPHSERLFPGAIEAVKVAASLGPVVVVSMKHFDELARSIRRLDLSHYVDAFFGDDDEVTPLKPNVALWTDVILPRFQGKRADETLMLGDTAHDLEFARNAGLNSCWASYGYGSAEACRAVGFDFEASSPGGLVDVITSAGTRR